MSGEVEAAGEVLTGGIVGATVEGATNAPGIRAPGEVHGNCLNCGAELTGAYCSSCGQPAHIHRSLASLGHDILHGVFHFEGKIWRTLPELFFHPGRLTRRYIDGERAKFVSPMALFLFTVFLMFAVFAFTGGMLLKDTGATETAGSVKTNFKSGNASALEATNHRIEALRKELESPDLEADRKAIIQKDIADLESSKIVMEALASGDLNRLTNVGETIKAQQAAAEAERSVSAETERSATPSAAGTKDTPQNQSIDLGGKWPTLEKRLNAGVRQINENPSLLLYKLKTNGYKFSWALIPLSVPFLWLMFFWRRDVHLYDHAIFATYSITFMMLLVIVLSLAAAVGVPGIIWGWALALAPPIHMYKHLRYTYGLSRFGATMRLFLLLISIGIVILIFSMALLAVGVLT
jgi:Protein of unknown function (DUF3667)